MKKSAQELRDLVDNLHPRSPKDVMGEAASSSLLGSTMTAALSTIGLLFGITMVVFILGGGPDKTTEAAVQPVQSIADTQAATTPVAASTDSDTPMTTTQPAKSDAETAIDAMGIGESKDPDSEPKSLENRLDELLDGLE